jgi:hypothetical protein
MAKDLMQQENITLATALKALGLSKSSYYYQPNPSNDKRTKQLDNTLVYKLKELTGYELVYGYRKVTTLFKQYNHKKIYRHMKVFKKAILRLSPPKGLICYSDRGSQYVFNDFKVLLV